MQVLGLLGPGSREPCKPGTLGRDDNHMRGPGAQQRVDRATTSNAPAFIDSDPSEPVSIGMC
jgi:hypothetical protein